jgi:hypothetical protein
MIDANDQLQRVWTAERQRDEQRLLATLSQRDWPGFDLYGVFPHLKSAALIETFASVVTSPGLQSIVPVREQAALAQALVAKASADNEELTVSYIREYLRIHASPFGPHWYPQGHRRKPDAKQAWLYRSEQLQEKLARQARGLLGTAFALTDHAKHRPPGMTLHQTSEFRDAINAIRRLINQLR